MPGNAPDAWRLAEAGTVICDGFEVAGVCLVVTDPRRVQRQLSSIVEQTRVFIAKGLAQILELNHRAELLFLHTHVAVSITQMPICDGKRRRRVTCEHTLKL